MLPDFTNFITIGKITKSIGLKGYVKVIPLTDFPERFKNTDSVYLYSEKRKTFLRNEKDKCDNYRIEEAGIYKDYLRVKLSGVDTLDDANSLKDILIAVELKDRVKIPDNSYYFYELIDCIVISNDEEIGMVTGVENYGGDDLLKVKLKKTAEEIFIPLRDEFIREIDKTGRKIKVNLIEGFLED